MSREVDTCSLNSAERDLRNNDSAADPAFAGYNLLQKLSYDHLEALKYAYKSKTPDESLNKSEFVEALESILDYENAAKESIEIFQAILERKSNDVDDDIDLKKITWNDFLDYFIENLNKESPRHVTLSISKITAASHVKKETIIKIVLIETDKYFCYAMIAKHGRVGLYDGNLNFLTSYHLIMTREDISRQEHERRRRNRWVTDAIFCVDVLMFIATNSARSVIIYEASGLKHVPMWLILSTPNIVNCLAYRSITNGNSTLFMGDNSGSLLSFNFCQPKVGLFRKKHNDKLSLFYWDELREEKDFVSIKRYGKFHSDDIKHVQYFRDNGTIITCSRDAETSLLIKYLNNKSKSYSFKMRRGCNCFVLSRVLKILITGSDDGLLRIWNPIITSKAVAILRGHEAGIVDVRIFEEQKAFLSCSRDGYLKLWDIDDQKCIQTLIINFPSFNIFGKLIEWGIESIYPGPKRAINVMGEKELKKWERSHILVLCCNYFAIIKLHFADNAIEQSFDSPVLMPPPLQCSVLIPKSWKIKDNIDFKDPIETMMVPPRSKDECVEEIKEKIDPKIVENRLNEYKFFLDKDLCAEFGVKSDINFKIALLENKKLSMQDHVARGAPYLALDLYEVEKLKITPGLPTVNKKTKGLIEKIENILEGANARDIIFSEPSSSSRSTPRSSRSSTVMEFDY